MTVPSSRRSQKPGNEPEFNTLDEPIRDTVVSVMLLITFMNKKNTYGGGGIAPPFLTSALDGGEWSASRPGRYPREGAPDTH
jgi:hypothetical protein